MNVLELKYWKIIVSFFIVVSIFSFNLLADDLNSNLQKALRYYQNRKYQSAVELLEDILNYRDIPQVRRFLATVYNQWALDVSRKNPREAEELFEKAIKWSPNQPIIRLNYAQLLYRMKKYEETIYQLESVYDRAGGSIAEKFNFLLGRAHLQLNDLGRAEYYFSRLSSEKYPEILFFQGMIRYLEGDLEKARKLWEKFQKEYPHLAVRYAISKWLKKTRRELKIEGAFLKDKSNHFYLFAEKGIYDDLTEFLLIFEDAYSLVGREFSFYPANRIPVVIYTSKKEYQQATFSPRWSGGLWDGVKIRLPAELLKINKDLLKITIFHEYVHLVIAKKYQHPRQIPLWLNEGCAQYFSYSLVNKKYPSLKYPGDYRKYLPYLWEDSLFRNAQSASFAYYFSYKLIEWIVADFGKEKVFKLLNSYSSQGRDDEKVVSQVFGCEKKEFLKKFSEYLDSHVED